VDLRWDNGRVHGDVSLPAGLSGTFRYADKTVVLHPGALSVDL
jgi:hypothetical protein